MRSLNWSLKLFYVANWSFLFVLANLCESHKPLYYDYFKLFFGITPPSYLYWYFCRNYGKSIPFTHIIYKSWNLLFALLRRGIYAHRIHIEHVIHVRSCKAFKPNMYLILYFLVKLRPSHCKLFFQHYFVCLLCLCFVVPIHSFLCVCVQTSNILWSWIILSFIFVVFFVYCISTKMLFVFVVDKSNFDCDFINLAKKKICFLLPTLFH